MKAEAPATKPLRTILAGAFGACHLLELLADLHLLFHKQIGAHMDRVFSANDLEWKNLRGLPGARGFEYKALSDGEYSSAFNSELVRLEPGDHSVPHVETWSHLLYFMSGTGDITIGQETTIVGPGSVALVKAGEKHSLRNLGQDNMVIFTVYDPPRTRPADS